MLNSSIISKTFEKEGLGKIKIAKLNDKLIFNLHDSCFNLGYTKKNGLGKIYLRKDKIENICESLDIKGVSLGDTSKIRITENIDFKNTWLNEKDFYALCLESHAKNAKPFREWVTGEVLPSIRKTGQYKIGEDKPKYKLPKNFSEALRQLADEVDENNKLRNDIKGMKPKADYTERILKNPGLVSITQVSKDYGLSGAEMNKLLHGLKVQYKKSGQWLLYSQYDGKGYVHSDTVDIKHKDGREDVKMNTKWTQAGRLFLYNLLKSKNVLPLIETQQQIMELGRN